MSEEIEVNKYESYPNYNFSEADENSLDCTTVEVSQNKLAELEKMRKEYNNSKEKFMKELANLIGESYGW